MREWIPDRNENEEFAPGVYCFTDETPQGRGGAAWVVLCRRKGEEKWYWYCLKHRSSACVDTVRINELKRVNNDAEQDGS